MQAPGVPGVMQRGQFMPNDDCGSVQMPGIGQVLADLELAQRHISMRELLLMSTCLSQVAPTPAHFRV
jgi:hypothetical protein